MATQLSRELLSQEFRDGERPSGDDFASAWLSFLNKVDDGVNIDGDGNLLLSKGVTLKDVNAGQAGTLRFRNNQLQYHDGTDFRAVTTGSSGAFQQVGNGPHVAFGAGNVGIGNFATPPPYRLQVNLADDSTTQDRRVRFGNLVIQNGVQARPGIYISHANQEGNTTGFALFQDSFGSTALNTATNTQLVLSQNAVNRIRILSSGAIELTPATTVSILGDTAIGSNDSNRNLFVFGQAFKPGGGPFSPPASDVRVKKEIRPFQEGLRKLTALKPVVYKFNGKAQTPDDGHDYIGLVAQEVQEVFPEMVISRSLKLEENDQNETDILTYEQGPITFVMINAIKELAARLDKLEK